MATPEQIYNAIQAISDQNSFVHTLLMDTLGWPIPDGIDDIGDITFEWSGEELQADGLDKHLTDGRVYQIRKLEADQPWGIFLLEFVNDDVFLKNRGLTGPLRKVLRGLVHNRRKSAHLRSWRCDDLLFICTDKHYHNFRFAYFKAPKETEKNAPLSLFGWNHGDTALHTLCDYNLYSLVWSDDINQPQWKEAFSIEKVTKAFFRQVAKLFTDLVGGTRKEGSKTYQGENLLKMPGKQDDTVRKEFAVRLIGRLIFCWFLKKKVSKAGIPLVPDEILSTAALANNKGVGGYYHSVLEPLFFELLNTPADSRKKDYRNQPWSYIPFLNGGLFTPHEFDFYELADTGYSKHINTLLVPDEWLNNLLIIFERYNFTIDENTPVDIELSIEPEMLGRIFENLLAEINPETGETARKSTGSYYTPRPIVEYMVDESLKQYLVTKTGIAEDKIASLLSYAEEDGSGFTEDQTEALIDALHTVKIIDPACGSGAFPMGILQKILLMLQKLDPDSKRWLDKLLAGIPDPMYRKELKKKIKVPNYLHKLGIIRDCIFGVDIQPIAVEISKLRCFLSLIVDENVEDTDDNRGVEHLPNLEFKFVCANTLIGLPESEQQNDTFIKDMYEDVDNIQKLKELREGYLTSYGKEKKRIEDDFKKVQSAMLNQTIDSKKVNLRTSALQGWEPFSDKPCSWFDPEWMFGIKGRFDIVIANPPWGAKLLKKEKELFKSIYPNIDSSTPNTFSYFLGWAVGSHESIISYVLPDSILIKDYAKTRALIKDYISEIVWYENTGMPDEHRPFVYVDHDVCLTNILKSKSENLNYSLYRFDKNKNRVAQNRFVQAKSKIILKEFDFAFNLIAQERDFKILNKISRHEKLSDFMQCHEGIHTGNSREILFLDKKGNKHCRPLFYGGGAGDRIENYISWASGWFVDYRAELINKSEGFYASLRDERIFKYPKIYISRTGNPFKAFYDENTYASNNFFSLQHIDYSKNDSQFLKYILPFIISKVAQYFIRTFAAPRLGSTFVETKIFHLLKFRVPILSKGENKSIVDLVDKILAVKKQNPETDTKELENQIDQMVYELYGLTDAEIAIVENSTK